MLINNLRKIERYFLWGGEIGKKENLLGKFDTICKSMKRGGIGIKDLRLFNMSLLAKWKWALFPHEDVL